MGIPLITICYLLVNIGYITVLTPQEILNTDAVAVVSHVIFLKQQISRYLRFRTERVYPKCFLTKNLKSLSSFINNLEFKCETRRKKREKSGVHLARASPEQR